MKGDAMTQEQRSREPMIHNLKTWPEPFEKIWNGSKTAEFRKDDRDFRIGDFVILREFYPIDPNEQADPASGMFKDETKRGYTGRSIRGTITDKTTGFGIPDGFCVLSIHVFERLSS